MIIIYKHNMKIAESTLAKNNICNTLLNIGFIVSKWFTVYAVIASNKTQPIFHFLHVLVRQNYVIYTITTYKDQL